MGAIGYTREYEGKKLCVFGNMTSEEIAVNDNGVLQEGAVLIQNYSDLPETHDAGFALRPYELVAFWG